MFEHFNTIYYPQTLFPIMSPREKRLGRSNFTGDSKIEKAQRSLEKMIFKNPYIISVSSANNMISVRVLNDRTAQQMQALLVENKFMGIPVTVQIAKPSIAL